MLLDFSYGGGHKQSNLKDLCLRTLETRTRHHDQGSVFQPIAAGSEIDMAPFHPGQGGTPCRLCSNWTSAALPLRFAFKLAVLLCSDALLRDKATADTTAAPTTPQNRTRPGVQAITPSTAGQTPGREGEHEVSQHSQLSQTVMYLANHTSIRPPTLGLPGSVPASEPREHHWHARHGQRQPGPDPCHRHHTGRANASAYLGLDPETAAQETMGVGGLSARESHRRPLSGAALLRVRYRRVGASHRGHILPLDTTEPAHEQV